MYYAAEHFHFSGVLAVVSGGLLLSSKRQSMLTYLSRLQSTNVWVSLVFIMNGLVFMLIGLQLPSVVAQLGDTSLETAIGYGLIISLVLIISRIVCSMGASVFTRFISRYITVADANPRMEITPNTWLGRYAWRCILSFCPFGSIAHSRRAGFPE